MFTGAFATLACPKQKQFNGGLAGLLVLLDLSLYLAVHFGLTGISNLIYKMFQKLPFVAGCIAIAHFQDLFHEANFLCWLGDTESGYCTMQPNLLALRNWKGR